MANMTYFPNGSNNIIDIESIWIKKDENTISVKGINTVNLEELLEKLASNLKFKSFEFQIDDYSNPYRDFYLTLGFLPVNFLKILVTNNWFFSSSVINNYVIKEEVNNLLSSNQSFIMFGTTNCDIWPNFIPDKDDLIVSFEGDFLSTQRIVCYVRDINFRRLIEGLIKYLENTDDNLKNMDINSILKDLGEFTDKELSLARVK